jgi:hypothetical protein
MIYGCCDVLSLNALNALNALKTNQPKATVKFTPLECVALCCRCGVYLCLVVLWISINSSGTIMLPFTRLRAFVIDFWKCHSWRRRPRAGCFVLDSCGQAFELGAVLKE